MDITSEITERVRKGLFDYFYRHNKADLGKTFQAPKRIIRIETEINFCLEKLTDDIKSQMKQTENIDNFENKNCQITKKKISKKQNFPKKSSLFREKNKPTLSANKHSIIGK